MYLSTIRYQLHLMMKIFRKYARINIILGWEVLRIASNLNSIFGLVNTDVINQHFRGQLQVLKVDTTEAFGDT
jgi:hypothetical protein